MRKGGEDAGVEGGKEERAMKREYRGGGIVMRANWVDR